MSTTTIEQTARLRIDALLERQAEERRVLAADLERQEADEAAALRAAVLPDAGTALAEAVADLERQVRRDVKADRLLAAVATDLPGWADANLPPLDPDDAEAGGKRVIVFLPRPFATGHREHLALGLVDLTDAVFGHGARARHDREVAERAREVEAVYAGRRAADAAASQRR